MIKLSAVEARVVGVLMEKEITTPEYYPLSANATLNGCNQKSSREPVMSLSEADVRGALFELDQLGLVRTLEDTRVTKFEHRMREGLGGAPLRRDEVAVVCLLLLRGPQTPAELRARAERQYSFDDNAAVQTTLERLAAREEPLVALLPRQPGAREARWAHLLSGPVEAATASLPAAAPAFATHAAPAFGTAIQDRVTQLESQVAELEGRLAALEAQLGISEG
ncbi:hypothetical protein SAMN05421819_1935 [Bryocella elongata]|uniref:Uncharacterized protein n=1 Tax=Bryocella elongata TaxID=863522 RepID=A0A1H5XR95_9BACT|nr:YceH family protein [Bryocella elongata]SEG14214.1 hypothetical protein SAMN05421819_1935 [Bryocella elongata]